jgi:microcystin-dependent protein
MSEPFLGMIIIVPYNFAPRGWAFCNGQILSISQNTALFSLLGTTFGGNGQTTFALPDLRGRFPNSSGQGPGLSNYSLGQVSGTESTTLVASNLPPHNHSINGVDDDPALGLLKGNSLANAPNAQTNLYNKSAPNAAMNPNVCGQGPGQSLPVAIMPPYLTLNFCIALEGIFPSRN